MKSLGSTTWLIPDGFRPITGVEPYPSHEAICVLNTGDVDARLRVTVYLEEAEPLEGFALCCEARRTRHIRTSSILSPDGREIPKAVPYAMLVESDVPVVVQYSRMDCTQPAMTLMTTMAHPMDGGGRA